MTVTANLYSALSLWTSATYTTGTLRTGATPASGNTVNVYRCVTGGSGGTIPTGTSTSPTTFGGGTASWVWLSAITFYGATADAMFSAAVAGATSVGGATGSVTQPVVWELWNQNGVSQTTSGTNPFLALSGHSFTPTNTLTVRAAPGESICDQPNSSNTPLAFNAAAGVSFTLPGTTGSTNYFDINDPNVIFQGLQFKDPNATSGSTILLIDTAATNFKLDRCIVDGTGQSGGAYIIYWGTTNSLAVNSVYVDRQTLNANNIPFVSTSASTGRMANCTFIAINSQSTTQGHDNNNSTSGSWVFVNCVSINYVFGIAVCPPAAAGTVISYSVTDAPAIGHTATDGGHNLVSQTASSLFISTTTDFRFRLNSGSPLINAGTTDTTDIPAAIDFFGTARPQGSAWCVGAYEPPLIQLGVRSRSTSAGRGGIFIQLPPAMSGFAKSSGISAVTAAMPLTVRGVAASRSVSPFVAIAGLRTHSAAEAFGRASGTFTFPQTTAGTARSSGKNSIGVVLPLVARGTAISAGKVKAAAAIPARGTAKSSGRISPPAQAAVMSTTGKALGQGRGPGLYTTPARPILGISRAFGKVAQATLTAPLSATGTAKSAGVALPGPLEILSASSGVGRAFGATPLASLTALVTAKGTGKSSGSGRTGVAQLLTARGTSKAFSTAGTSFNAFLNNHSSAAGSGKVAAFTMTAALAAQSLGQSTSVAPGIFQTPLATKSKGASAGRGQEIISLFLTALGTAQCSGQLGNTATQRLSVQGTGMARGVARSSAAAKVSATARAASNGRAGITCVRPIAASGISISKGTGLTGNILTVPTRGLAVAKGTSVGLFAVALTSLGAARSSGVSTTSLNARMSVHGTAAARGAFAAPTGTAQLMANSLAVGKGRITAIFAPVALIARGQASGFGRPLASYQVALPSLGIGLSRGRCAATAAVVLQANGCSRAAGRVTIANTVGFIARSRAIGRGYLFSQQTIAALGRAAGSGSGLISAYYNVTPDITGARLSALTQLPSFNDMDFADADFFSWDWSTRVSAANDPIVSASVVSLPTGLPVGSAVIVGNIVQVLVGAAPATVETFSLRCTVTLRSGRVLHWSAPVAVAAF